jgi:hypothetical protein
MDDHGLTMTPAERRAHWRRLLGIVAIPLLRVWCFVALGAAVAGLCCVAVHEGAHLVRAQSDGAGVGLCMALADPLWRALWER